MMFELVRRIFGITDLKVPQTSDVFIASFPKSGNTWTRFVLANLLSRCREEIHFKNFDRIIPEWKVHDTYLENISSPRLIKTHELHSEGFKKAIYLIRDPRDAYVSYYFYQKKHWESLGISTFSEFVKAKPFKYSWSQHVESWLNCENLLILKYEMLISDPIGEFSKLFEFLPEFPIYASDLKEAVLRSKFSNMRQLEIEKGRPFKSKQHEEMSSQFMRKGKVGDWQNYFDKELLSHFHEQHAEYMEKFSY